MLITGLFLHCTSQRSPVNHTVCSVSVDEVWVCVGAALSLSGFGSSQAVCHCSC